MVSSHPIGRDDQLGHANLGALNPTKLPQKSHHVELHLYEIRTPSGQFISVPQAMDVNVWVLPL
jgi:hypothetical protein